MSLYGALFSGVSGLAAQSSAMGAISDNITNVNTIGYKGSKVNFQTLVTKQVSLTNYSPGGVQSRPRTGVDVQGLLQATNSSTDVSLSGRGFFVVNEAAKPENGDMFAYTRAGSFKVDQEGYLQNVAGWYMQGWPLMSWDNSAQASTVQVGNNVFMKSYKDETGNTVYINDNIVSAQHLRPINLNEVGGTASQTRNLRMGANLPNGAAVGTIYKQPVTIYDSLGGDATVQFSWQKKSQNNWGVEAVPPLGAKSITLKNANASNNPGNVYGTMGRLDFLGLPQTTGRLDMSINGTTYNFHTSGAAADGSTLNQFYTTPTGVSVSAFSSNLASDINLAHNLEYNSLGLAIAAGGTAGASTLQVTVDGVTQTFNIAGGSTASAAATALNGDVNFTGQGLTAFANGNNLYVYSSTAMSFTLGGTLEADANAGTWTNNATGAAATTKTTNGKIYAELLAGTNSLIIRQENINTATVISGLNSLDLANGNPATIQGMDPTNPDTFTLAAAPDSASSAIEFNGDGTPKDINVAFIEVDWANGSLDMDGDNAIGFFLGNLNIRDGMTQLNGDYQLAYWSQNGAKFGNFAGVTIGADGIVTALFDNGVTRPVFQIPIATFVNPNGMESMSGNVFIATDKSGEPTLRTAGAAGAGQVAAASLEASTVDIGEEFTTMIVTQRAYSAAAKIITTSDEMLDELIRVKR